MYVACLRFSLPVNKNEKDLLTTYEHQLKEIMWP
jgi:hypothetical protein